MKKKFNNFFSIVLILISFFVGLFSGFIIENINSNISHKDIIKKSQNDDYDFLEVLGIGYESYLGYFLTLNNDLIICESTTEFILGQTSTISFSIDFIKENSIISTNYFDYTFDLDFNFLEFVNSNVLSFYSAVEFQHGSNNNICLFTFGIIFIDFSNEEILSYHTFEEEIILPFYYNFLYSNDDLFVCLIDFSFFYNLGLNSSLPNNSNPFDIIWNLISNSINSFLNIFKINLLPGIPLYSLFVIPIIFALFLFVLNVLKEH